MPDWTTAIEGAPSIYFTLGTVFNHESGDLFARVLAGLRELPVNLLVTVGREIDPASATGTPRRPRSGDGILAQPVTQAAAPECPPVE
jgi:UDP:flavonoid glycosyltransferase YjiC (YdhE family)